MEDTKEYAGEQYSETYLKFPAILPLSPMGRGDLRLDGKGFEKFKGVNHEKGLYC